MKKFKFKLDILLRIKGHEEKQCKLSMGVLIQKKGLIDQKMLQIQKSLNEIRSQSGVQAGEISNIARNLPQMIRGLVSEYDLKSEEASSIDVEIEEKRKELAQIMAEKKGLENLREKRYQTFLKKKKQKMYNDLEESYQYVQYFKNNTD